MITAKEEFKKYQKDWLSNKNVELFRHGIAMERETCKKGNSKKLLKIARDKLANFFGESFFAIGRIEEELKTITDIADWENILGLGVEIKAKKNRINVKSWITYLLMIMRRNERYIEELKESVKGQETNHRNYLATLNKKLEKLSNRKSIPKVRSGIVKMRENIQQEIVSLLELRSN